MGVKLLSKLLKTECGDCVNKVHLQQLYNKKICIDTSIYLYRFKSMGGLLEKFYLMCSIFKQYINLVLDKNHSAIMGLINKEVIKFK